MIVPTQPAAPRTLRSLALLLLRCLLRLLRTTRVLRCMSRFCHAPLVQRLARLTPACLLPMLVRCLLFLRLLLLLRTLLPLFRPTFLLPFVPSWGPRGRPDPLWSRARRPWSSDFRPGVFQTRAPDLLWSGRNGPMPSHTNSGTALNAPHGLRSRLGHQRCSRSRGIRDNPRRFSGDRARCCHDASRPRDSEDRRG